MTPRFRKTTDVRVSYLHSSSAMWWLWGLIAVVMFSTEAHGQEVKPDKPADSIILARLNDPDYSVRHAETNRLLLDSNLTEADIERLYAQSATPEQQHRLLRVARHHLIRRMMEENYGDQPGPGSMGLSHHVVEVSVPNTQNPQTGVLVVMTLPGFPAYALLDPGDVIIGFAGEPVPSNISPSRFQQMIRNYQAGQTISLTVVRQGDRHRLSFRFGYAQGLGEVYDTSGVTLNEPYRSSWAKLREKLRFLSNESPPRDNDTDAHTSQSSGHISP